MSINLAYKIHQEALNDIVLCDPYIFSPLFGGMQQFKIATESKMWSYLNAIIIALEFSVIDEFLSGFSNSISINFDKWKNKNFGKNVTGSLANLLEDSVFLQKIGECYLHLVSPLFQKAKELQKYKSVKE